MTRKESSNMKELTIRPMSEKDIRWLAKGLKSFGFFSRLTVSQMASIFPYMTVGDCRKGHVVVRQGAKGNRLYLIQEGTVEILRDGKKVAALGPGHFFGEMALLFKQPRSATVRCAKACVLFSLGNTDLGRIMRKNRSVGRQIQKIAERRRLELEQMS